MNSPKTPRRLRKLVAAQLVAAGLGIGVAGLAKADSSGVHRAVAATHCTRYAPTYSIDYACQQSGSMSYGTSYQTTSTAFRDENSVWDSPASNWSLLYINQYGGFIKGNNGFSLGGLQGSGSDGIRAYSICQAGTGSGYCFTQWHD